MAPDNADPRQEAHPGARRTNRLVLTGLVAIFLVPILTAYSLNVWWPHWSPFGRMNHGEIVEPGWEVDLGALDPQAAARAAGHWILLHLAAGPCDEACEVRLDMVRRVHVSLGKDHDRVVRLLVHPADRPPGPLRSMDASLVRVPAPTQWFDRFVGDRPLLLVIDPQRQAVLRYGTGLTGKGLARDLARLLKISRIG